MRASGTRCRFHTRLEYAAIWRGRGERARLARAAAGILGAALLACGTATGTDAPPGSSTAVVQIINYTFFPQRITATPGSAVLFLNLDGVEHAVATEAAPGSYVPDTVNGVFFMTPPFGASMPVSIPATATPGTVIPYFCWMHPGASPDGEIDIVAP